MNRRKWGSKRGSRGRPSLGREAGRQTRRQRKSVGCKLQYKSTKMEAEKGSTWSFGLTLDCITDQRKWASKREPRGRVASYREGSRQTIGSGQSAGSKLHYKSPKIGIEKRFAWAFGLGSGRGSPGCRPGAVSGPQIALQIDENGGRAATDRKSVV